MHLFLTGNIQVGKSTVIQRYLKKYGYSVKGFRTVSGPFSEDGSSEIYMVAADKPEEMIPEHVVIKRNGPHSLRGFSVNLDVYEEYGVELLENVDGCDIILMDELGPKEEEAIAFRQKVMEHLDGDRPILGVLMKKDSPVFADVKNHPDVVVIEVTEENRERIYQGIPPIEKWSSENAFDACK